MHDAPDDAGHVECLTFYRDAYEDEIIDITARNQLRNETLDALAGHFVEALTVDEALARFAELYEEDLIDITARNNGRDEMRRQEN